MNLIKGKIYRYIGGKNPTKVEYVEKFGEQYLFKHIGGISPFDLSEKEVRYFIKEQPTRKKIIIKHGGHKKLMQIFKTTYPTVCNALNYRCDSDISRRIRKGAFERGGVEVEY
ncbi:MAG: hypothetical protein LBN27_03620 [Prevotellaceae bacterium]|nr:hypothetical protein [Prevotellaceae bacterium]